MHNLSSFLRRGWLLCHQQHVFISDYFVCSQHSWEWNNCAYCDMAVRSQFLPVLQRDSEQGNPAEIPCPQGYSSPFASAENPMSSNLQQVKDMWMLSPWCVSSPFVFEQKNSIFLFLLSNRWWICVCHLLLLDLSLSSYSGFELFCFRVCLSPSFLMPDSAQICLWSAPVEELLCCCPALIFPGPGWPWYLTPEIVRSNSVILFLQFFLGSPAGAGKLYFVPLIALM